MSRCKSVRVGTGCIFAHFLFMFVCLCTRVFECLCVYVFVYTQVTSERLWDGVQLWSLVWGEGGGWGGEAQPPSASVTSSSSQALWAHAFHTISYLFFRFNHELCVSLVVRYLATCQVGLLAKPPLSRWQTSQTSDQWSFSFKNKPVVFLDWSIGGPIINVKLFDFEIVWEDNLSNTFMPPFR